MVEYVPCTREKHLFRLRRDWRSCQERMRPGFDSRWVHFWNRTSIPSDFARYYSEGKFEKTERGREQVGPFKF